MVILAGLVEFLVVAFICIFGITWTIEYWINKFKKK